MFFCAWYRSQFLLWKKPLPDEIFGSGWIFLFEGVDEKYSRVGGLNTLLRGLLFGSQLFNEQPNLL
jgi:hypothetical protein